MQLWRYKTDCFLQEDSVNLQLNHEIVFLVSFSIAENNEPLKRSEYVDEHLVASDGPELPYPVQQHCMAKISEDEVWLIGGTQSNQ